MHELEFSANYSNFVGRVLLYNPDKWECSEYYFFKSLPVNSSVLKERYDISKYIMSGTHKGEFFRITPTNKVLEIIDKSGLLHRLFI